MTMGATMPDATRIEVTPTEHVTAIAYPATARDRAGITLILAHGAGANQMSGFMVHFATALAARGIDTLTFNFVYSETNRRLPDRTDKLEACYRHVIQASHDGVFDKRLGHGKLVIGGKSMGGRIASQVAAAGVDDVTGLVFLGYPLHPAGKPEQARVKHLPAIRLPMLFVQGSRDAFGTPDELRPVIRRLEAPAELCVVAGGDHSFKVPKRAGPSQEEVHEFVLDEIARWLRGISQDRISREKQKP
jgi:predicted alpha/beta-hydrolase family hydrolase